jgi:hypothetical protein
MASLDALYIRILHLGFIVLRQAIDSNRPDWVEAELQMLHNIPSLVGEKNVLRHQYYWLKERPTYVAWVSSPGRDEEKSRMRMFYKPIWDEMAQPMEELLAELGRHE